MSYTADTVIDTRPLPDVVATPRRPWRRWPAWILGLLLCLWLTDTGISILIQHTRLRAELTAHLQSDFGRPVEVGSYSFSLWSGPALEAQSVTVSEDPRFGNEYFLRSESLTMGLRWQSLIRARLELGTLSLKQPSLNVVRSEEGDWNIANWLPRLSVPSSVDGAGGSRRASFGKIEVDGGRINFKRVDEKLPFALVGVAGTVEADASGLWTIDLDAIPWRAAENIQNAGMIHVAGHVGGTSSRLLPAALDLAWNDASVSDVLRLAQSYDHGIRGTMALQLNAQTQGASWFLQGRAELRQLHRWDLPIRSDNPGLNLLAKMKVSPNGSGVEISDAILEGPHSNARATGTISWVPPSPKIPSGNSPPPGLQITSSAIELGDVLTWVRAFHSDVAQDISATGSAGLDAAFAGWPPHLSTVSITSPGAELRANRLRVPVRMGQTAFRYDGGRVSMPPATVTFGVSDAPAQGFVKADITPVMARNGHPASGTSVDTHITGSMTQIRDLIATAGELGWKFSQSWDLAGPLRFDVRWRAQGNPLSSPSPSTGFIESGVIAAKIVEPDTVSLHVPFLNQPIEQIVGRVDWKSNQRHISLTGAKAFGANWKGTFDRLDSDPSWKFALAADRLTSTDLDRWLNPRWHETFLYRMLPFLNSGPSANSIPENQRASGTLSLDQFTLPPLVVHALTGTLDIEGRHIRLQNGKGRLYGGQVNGSFDANLHPLPQYEANIEYDGVDLSALSSASEALSDLFDGSADGQATFSARGATRADLIASIECQGWVNARRVELRMIDLTDSFRDDARRVGTSNFPRAFTNFSCEDHNLQFRDLTLSGTGPEIQGQGSLTPNRTLDFQLHRVEGGAAPGTDAPSDDSIRLPAPGELYHVTGPLSSPELNRVPVPIHHRP